jgi:hypothetical protein
MLQTRGIKARQKLERAFPLLRDNSSKPFTMGQRFIAIADVVLTELSGGVSETLEQTADGRIELAHPHRRAGKANFR